MRERVADVKQPYTRQITVMLTAFILLALALPAHADIPVKFFGDIVANELSPKHAKVVDKFFAADPRNRSAFACFQGDLLNLRHGRKVGVGVDCLRIGSIEDATTGVPKDEPVVDMIMNTVDLHLVIDAVTFFFLPGGHIVSDGFTTARPFFKEVGNGDGTADEGSVTHMTGSIPGKTPNIVEATGIYRKLKNRGNVRLSGAVNLGLKDSVFFTCLFVIQKGHVRAY